MLNDYPCVAIRLRCNMCYIVHLHDISDAKTSFKVCEKVETLTLAFSTKHLRALFFCFDMSEMMFRIHQNAHPPCFAIS